MANKLLSVTKQQKGTSVFQLIMSYAESKNLVYNVLDKKDSIVLIVKLKYGRQIEVDFSTNGSTPNVLQRTEVILKELDTTLDFFNNNKLCSASFIPEFTVYKPCIAKRTNHE